MVVLLLIYLLKITFSEQFMDIFSLPLVNNSIKRIQTAWWFQSGSCNLLQQLLEHAFFLSKLSTYLCILALEQNCNFPHIFLHFQTTSVHIAAAAGIVYFFISWCCDGLYVSLLRFKNNPTTMVEYFLSAFSKSVLNCSMKI